MLVKKTKVTDIESRIPNDKYITTPDFDKLTE